MSALPKFAPEQQMTIEEYLAFTETRPDEERWELIEGVPVLSPAPVQFHQVLASNIVTFLMVHKDKTGASWIPMLGVGTRVPVSPNSLPQPDVYVQQGAPTDQCVTDDALVIFEVLSRSNTKRDQEWRKRVYSSVPNCQHYVTVSLRAMAVCVFDRSREWQSRRLRDLAARLELPALAVEMPLAAIYRWTPFATPQPVAKAKPGAE